MKQRKNVTFDHKTLHRDFYPLTLSIIITNSEVKLKKSYA